MTVPTSFADLSTTAASNSPAGGDNVLPDLDNYIRIAFAMLASIKANTATNGWVSLYATAASPTFTGAITLGTGGITSRAFTPTSSQGVIATPTFDASLSNVFEFSSALDRNVTSCTITNPSNGQTIMIRVKQNGSGGFTFAAPSGAKILGSISTTANAASILTLTYSAMDARWEGSWVPLPA
jgi:hypothetical protein